MKKETPISQEKFNEQLMSFLQASPTPHYAVANMAAELVKNGFKKLEEKDVWSLTAGGKYFTVKSGALIAFRLTKKDRVTSGFHIVGAHTDSPSLKIKPKPVIQHKNLIKLGVEIYGGANLFAWFDRDLSVAGSVSYVNKKGELKTGLIDFKRPIVVLPRLATHLGPLADAPVTIDKQKEIQPILLQADGKEKFDFDAWLLAEVKKQPYGKDVVRILSHDLSLYDVAAPQICGARGEFIASQRIDNLTCCFVGIKALVEEGDDHVTSVLVCNDHEEVGSSSTTGAAGIMLKSVLKRICGSGENYARAISQSFLISSDNSHAEHPNYPQVHDSNHAPQLNAGPVIKLNSNQKYATTTETAAFFKLLCQKAKVPVQEFVSNNNSRCGSTIGPITSTVTSLKTVDIGLPMLAMHSIRELMGVKDALYLHKALKEFYSAKK